MLLGKPVDCKEPLDDVPNMPTADRRRNVNERGPRRVAQTESTIDRL